MIWLISAAFLLVPAALQWMVLRVTEMCLRVLRWALLALPVLLVWRGRWYLHAPWEEYPHPDGLAGTLLYLFAALSLAGWGLGWALYRFQNRRKKP